MAKPLVKKFILFMVILTVFISIFTIIILLLDPSLLVWLWPSTTYAERKRIEARWLSYIPKARLALHLTQYEVPKVEPDVSVLAKSVDMVPLYEQEPFPTIGVLAASQNPEAVKPLLNTALDKSRSEMVRNIAMGELIMLLLRLHENDEAYFEHNILPQTQFELEKYLLDEEDKWIEFADESGERLSYINGTAVTALSFLFYFGDPGFVENLMDKKVIGENNPAIISIFANSFMDQDAPDIRPSPRLIKKISSYQTSNNPLISLTASRVVIKYGDKWTALDNLKRISLSDAACSIRWRALAVHMETEYNYGTIKSIINEIDKKCPDKWKDFR